MFALVDCNNFYASCERVFRPDLNGKPIVVLSNNDGCVIARSNEAKAIGVPMGAPAFKYQDLFTQHSVRVFSANFALYGDMSMRVMNLLAGYCPAMEIYSIDEAFLDFTGMEHLQYKEYGVGVVKNIQKSTGIPVSIGIAPTKALAKVANRVAKKFPKETCSVYIIDTEEKRIKALKWLKIEDVWGIGRQHAKRLQALNIKTAYDFTNLEDEFIQSKMSIVEVRLKHELCGESMIELEGKTPKKTIATTRTFESNYTGYDQVKERVVTFSVSCAEKLRRQQSACRALMVFIRTNGFRNDLAQYSKSVVVKLPFATNSTIELAKFAEEGLRKIFKEGYAYKKAGVVLMDFCSEDEIQQNLFEHEHPKHKLLMKAIDNINSTTGRQIVKLASQDKDRIWKMKQEKLSPRYSTKLAEVITVKS